MTNIKKLITQNLINIPGWRTNRHIVVFESDDWGSIRMPSIETYESLIKNGVQLGTYGYEKVDTIASPCDLELLFELCDSFRDINNNPLVITANSVVANPDFEKIRKTDYSRYYWEPITTTMERYYPNQSPFPLWKEGMERMVFYPQLHGREHVNVPMWLKSLQNNYPGARECFEKGVFSFLVDKGVDIRKKNTSAYYYLTKDELSIIKQSIIEAAQIFKDLFGFYSKSFIAPSYKWDKSIEETLQSVGVKYLQGMFLHVENGEKHYNYIGRKNIFGQLYLNRTAFWEYSQNPDFDWTSDCLKRMTVSFRWHKPVTISVHRLNFIGSLSERNRDENLKRFKTLITKIQKEWPDVEFLTSDQLGDLISR
ncbi:hypothetical protein [Parabacteroides johnsonii]